MNRAIYIALIISIGLVSALFAVSVADPQTASPLSRAATSPEVTSTALTQQIPEGEGFKGFRFGAPLKDFFGIVKIRPLSPAHVAGDEENCEFYCPPKDLVFGDFKVRMSDVYLVFYKERLMRIRIFNTFSSRDDVDTRFFTAMRTALTQKYGNAPTKEQILTKFDGIYEWKTEKLRVGLSFTTLEYGWLALEKELAASMKKPSRISSSDI